MSRILVIDDEPSVRRVVARILQSVGHEVVQAADGREGVDQYGAKAADLVITDLSMPNQEGLETIQELRQRFPKVAIIAMLGWLAARTMLSIAKKLGALEVLQKPYSATELLAAVGRALEAESRSV